MKFLALIFLFICTLKISSQEKQWTPEEFLTGKFENNLGSYCILKSSNGKITGEYFTKPSRGKLIKKGFPVYGLYTPVKDGALISINTVFEMEGENEDGLEKITHANMIGKIYANKNTFKLNWLITSNQIEDKEWSSTNVGQDIFAKV